MAKTIFITGASRGFGRIWTEAFLRRGDNVVAAVRTPESLADLKQEFSSTLLVVKHDVRDRIGSFEAVENAVGHFGRIDVLINNAGFGHVGAVEELSESDVRAQFETNVLGSLWMVQAIIGSDHSAFKCFGTEHSSIDGTLQCYKICSGRSYRNPGKRSERFRHKSDHCRTGRILHRFLRK
jgi:NAD(P)-dependent dehydrogenase (short-subunit alcohol dehydrogenase family)